MRTPTIDWYQNNDSAWADLCDEEKKDKWRSTAIGLHDTRGRSDAKAVIALVCGFILGIVAAAYVFNFVVPA